MITEMLNPICTIEKDRCQFGRLFPHQQSAYFKPALLSINMALDPHFQFVSLKALHRLSLQIPIRRQFACVEGQLCFEPLVKIGWMNRSRQITPRHVSWNNESIEGGRRKHAWEIQ